ncbi:unnamed protein product [Owenia fusiformis]|uniref:Uncharacterized protein n=1 Tax=Owenia fusiformis TaxID=6347 RepID=A0A8J1TL37_OWEFU|nr:unnamed protein product [Owenia fusiformis]
MMLHLIMNFILSTFATCPATWTIFYGNLNITRHAISAADAFWNATQYCTSVRIPNNLRFIKYQVIIMFIPSPHSFPRVFMLWFHIISLPLSHHVFCNNVTIMVKFHTLACPVKTNVLKKFYHALTFKTIVQFRRTDITTGSDIIMERCCNGKYGIRSQRNRWVCRIRVFRSLIVRFIHGTFVSRRRGIKRTPKLPLPEHLEPRVAEI